MNKNELVEQVADRAGLSRGQAAGAVDAALAAIERELASGGEVTITGFGRFSVAERAARQARNPRTGEPIEVPAGRPALCPRQPAQARSSRRVTVAQRRAGPESNHHRRAASEARWRVGTDYEACVKHWPGGAVGTLAGP